MSKDIQIAYLEALDKIADLETKLAESKNEIKEWIAVRDDKNNVINKQTEKINQLKQQLAEKDNEIEKNETTISALRNSVYIDMLNIETLELRELTHNQDKISFAVEQLEKVKEKAIKPKDYGWCDKYKDCWDIVMDIDNQIKQLKEGK